MSNCLYKHSTYTTKLNIFDKNKLYKNNEAEMGKSKIKTNQENFEAGKFKKQKIEITIPHISFLTIYLQMNDLKIVRVIFCDVFGCSIRVCNFVLLSGVTRIL